MSNPLVLIIEDDVTLSHIFTVSLETNGFQVETCVSGIEAQENLKNRHTIPDLILLDLHLPNIPGTVLLEQIRANAKFNDTPVVIVTADPILGESVRQKKDHLLFKPISVIQLRKLALELTA